MAADPGAKTFLGAEVSQWALLLVIRQALFQLQLVAKAVDDVDRPRLLHNFQVEEIRPHSFGVG